MLLNIRRLGEEAIDTKLDKEELIASYRQHLHDDAELQRTAGNSTAADAIQRFLAEWQGRPLNEEEENLVDNIRAEEDIARERADELVEYPTVTLEIFRRILAVRAANRVFTLRNMDMRNLGGDPAIVDVNLRRNFNLGVIQQGFNGALSEVIEAPIQMVFKKKRILHNKVLDLDALQANPWDKKKKRELRELQSAMQAFKDVFKWILNFKGIEHARDAF